MLSVKSFFLVDKNSKLKDAKKEAKYVAAFFRCIYNNSLNQNDL